ncbi:MAG TPA: sigma-70 family RNA polymerase sigma factor [Actinomycetota bacterium]|nr:sigma-70 family RNA polymerase sigma factor [Actinomycetota bacterium]
MAQQAPRDFRTFFEDEHRRLFKTLYFVTGDRAEAADLMQEAFLKVWERWDRIDTIDDPQAYLFRVALNGWRMRVRTARRAATRTIPLGVVRDAYDDVDLREDVRRMLQAVTPRQRLALVLLDLYGYGSEDAARIMGIRPSTVRALATQGRAVLRATGGPHG